MTGREIRAAIYLSGVGGDYQVHHDIEGQAIVCHVPTARIGNAIVRALRELATLSRPTRRKAFLTRPAAHLAAAAATDPECGITPAVRAAINDKLVP